jgi:hypothetical protein
LLTKNTISTKLSFNLYEEIRTFQDKDKLKQFLFTKPALESILKRIIHMEEGEETISSWVPVAHAYNPSYSGSRDQEYCGLRPDWANCS